MSIGDPKISCNVCGVEKRDVNHWYQLVIGCMGGEVHIVDWDVKLAHVADAHVCGQGCALVLVSRWFQSKSFEIPAFVPAEERKSE